MSDSTDIDSYSSQSFPLKDQKSIDAFLHIVAHHLSDRTYGNGYPKTAFNILPNNRLDAEKKVKGQLKRLVHQKTMIKDEETLLWLWNYFITLDRWQYDLNLLAGTSASSSLAKKLHEHAVGNKYKNTQNHGYLANLIESEYATFFRLSHNNEADIFKDEDDFEETSQSNLSAYKFFATDNPYIFDYLMIDQNIESLNKSDESDFKIDHYEAGSLVYDQWSHIGTMILKDDTRKIIFNSRELHQATIYCEQNKKEIYKNHHEPAFFLIDHREIEYFIVNNTSNLAEKIRTTDFQEGFHTKHDIRLRLGGKRSLADKLTKIIDGMNVKMI